MSKDWRGTEIEVGSLVIYGAPVGRSIALVEGLVDGFTDSGRVWVTIIRRAYGGGWSGSKSRVHVGADRLVVVTELPPSDIPLTADKVAESNARMVSYYKDRLAEIDAGLAPATEDGWDIAQYYRTQLKRVGL